MKANDIEEGIINLLRHCTFSTGSFDKKFVHQVNVQDISPLQKYWIYKLGHKYRRQIANDVCANLCKNFLDHNPAPISRKESERIIKKLLKDDRKIKKSRRL